MALVYCDHSVILLSMNAQELIESKTSKEIIFIDVSQSVQEAAILMEKFHIGFLLVKSAEDFVGVLSERDIVYKVSTKNMLAAEQKVADIMTSKVVWCASDEPLMNCLQAMKNGGFRHLPIRSKEKEVKGVLTERDITNFLINSLQNK